MKRSLAIVVAGLCACLVHAEPFWISYDAACGHYPEEVGWTRYTHGGGAVRSLSDAVLTLDSTASSMICDYYEIDRSIMPGPGETFVAEWRVRVAQHSGYWESLAYTRVDDGHDAMFQYSLDEVRSYFEGWTVPITPNVFHTYRLESADLETYSFSIDNMCTHTGAFDHGPPIPFAIFGDITYGTTPGVSLTQWEYFEFGVVPEPSSLMLVLALPACALVARRRARRRGVLKGDVSCWVK